jgi:hypothetical protein
VAPPNVGESQARSISGLAVERARPLHRAARMAAYLIRVTGVYRLVPSEPQAHGPESPHRLAVNQTELEAWPPLVSKGRTCVGDGDTAAVPCGGESKKGPPGISAEGSFS